MSQNAGIEKIAMLSRCKTIFSNTRYESSRWRAIAVVCICVFSVLAHLSLLWGGFIWFDDTRVITNNLIVTDLTWEHFKEVTFTNYMGSASPFMYSVDMLNWAISPHYTGFAVVNLIWLAGTVVLFYLFSDAFIKDFRWRFMATALFSVIGINADSVGWMSARCHFMGIAFVLGCFILWRRYRESVNRFSRVAYYFFAIVAGVWAIWSKSIFITIGGLVFVYDWYFRRRITAGFILDKAPLFGAAIFALGQTPNGAVATGLSNPAMGTSLTSTLLNDAGLFVEYLRRMIVPGPTSVAVETYPVDGMWEMSPDSSLLAMQLPPAANIAILVIIAMGIWMASSRAGRSLWYAFVMFWVAFAPSMNIPPRWADFAFRFALLPSVFFCIVAALLLQRVVAFFENRESAFIAGKVAIGVIACWIGWQAVATFTQNRVMKNEKYWANCMENLPDTVVCYLKAEGYYSSKKMTKKLIETLETWDGLCRDRKVKNCFEPAYRLAKIYEGQGVKDKACDYFQQSLWSEKISANRRTYATKYLASCKKEG